MMATRHDCGLDKTRDDNGFALPVGTTLVRTTSARATEPSASVRPSTRFVAGNWRWLGGGLLLTFFSSAGQTFFIALFAGEIRAAYGLGHGGFGALYMVATLGSAVTLVWLGRIVDLQPVTRVATGVIAALCVACLWMAFSHGVASLVLALYLLRLFGQGMMTHVAMTAMGRWFDATRGRAVSVTALGYQLGEGVLPLAVVGLMAWFDWRTIWIGVAVVLVCVALPLSRLLWSVARTPQGSAGVIEERGPQWTRAEVLRDPPFRSVCTAVLAPAFIGTSVFFHQVHIAQIKGWGGATFAATFSLLAVTTVICGLASGRLIDRVGAYRLLPYFLVPLALACVVLSRGDAPLSAWAFMLLLGIAYGMSSSIFGAIWPELYGTRHLGSVRSVVFAAMVFASALGPGVTGWLIDLGVGFEFQLLVMAGYCVSSAGLMVPVRRTLAGRLEAVATAR